MRDLPVALARLGWQPTVLTPSYGVFHTLADAKESAAVEVIFRGIKTPVRCFELEDPDTGVTSIVFEHPAFVPLEPGEIYHNDADGRPYATDADKFALLCTAAAAWIDALDTPPDVVHLHDWHAAYYLLLREFSVGGERLRNIRTVFTIHNLSYQGQRPLTGDSSSLEAWFPGLAYDVSLIGDPDADDCINPMAFAIRSADKVHVVSPTYAKEICKPSDPLHGFVGGEGLEGELQAAAGEGRLHGILNGCDYSKPLGRRPGWQHLIRVAAATAEGWTHRDPGDTLHFLTLERLSQLPKRRPLHVLTSIGRIVSQKIQLFLQPLADGRTALEHILERLDRRGFLWLLGSGEARYEAELERIAQTSDNLLFFRGYSDTLGETMYRAGDLFLMPSSFEPCGISQMLAMRAGQPCVVHGVGGLRDTVEDRVTGFVFDGDTQADQAADFVDCVDRALALRSDDPAAWQAMKKRAADKRFDWASSAEQYVETLYEPD